MHSLFISRALCYCFLLSFCGMKASAIPSTEATNSEDKTPEPLQCQTQILEPTFDKSFQTRRVKVTYPSVSVPSMMIDDGMMEFLDLTTYLPCHDCLILSMEADLIYEDGTRATPSSSMWLHHAVFVKKGKLDHFCGPKSFGQRFFAVGNERTTVNMSSSSKHPRGYHIAETDQVAVSVELMNMAHNPQQVRFTATYEFIENIPEKFTSIEPIWLDIGGCRNSDVPAQRNSTFEFTSPTWSSTLSGEISFVGGHLHDGGMNLQIIKNDKTICESRPTYTTYSPDHDSCEEHVSSMSTCTNLGRLETNDELKVKAIYDTTAHKPMLRMDGSLEPVMGISLVYVEVDHSTAPGKKHCSKWPRSQNFMLAVFCLGLGTLLAVTWWRRSRRERASRVRREGVGMGMDWNGKGGQDFKLPLLSHDDSD